MIAFAQQTIELLFVCLVHTLYLIWAVLTTAMLGLVAMIPINMFINLLKNLL